MGLFRSNELELNKQKQVILYTARDGKVTVGVFFAQDTFWLTQKTIAELFGVKIPAISKHLKNIYTSKELTQFELFPKWKQFKLRANVKSCEK